MPACRGCDKEEGRYKRSEIEDVCDQCFHQRALAPPMEPQRRPAPCAQCGGTAIVRALLRQEDSFGELGISWKRQLKASPFSVDGALEAYICRRCGFTEIFARHPERIAIGPEYGTELIEIGSDSPYR